MLEICPTSNVRTGAVRDEAQMAEIVFELEAAGIPMVIATDGPEMIGTRLRAEYAMLVRLGALSAEAARARERPRARGQLHPPATIGAGLRGAGRSIAPGGAERRPSRVGGHQHQAVGARRQRAAADPARDHEAVAGPAVALAAHRARA